MGVNLLFFRWESAYCDLFITMLHLFCDKRGAFELLHKICDEKNLFARKGAVARALVTSTDKQHLESNRRRSFVFYVISF